MLHKQIISKHICLREKFKFAGQTVKIRSEIQKFGGAEFEIEDYWENVSGKSWMLSNGNPAAMFYAIRTGTQSFRTPIDNEVLYGKIGGLGYLFHVSELELPSNSGQMG